jgi:hypothetical protein
MAKQDSAFRNPHSAFESFFAWFGLRFTAVAYGADGSFQCFAHHFDGRLAAGEEQELQCRLADEHLHPRHYPTTMDPRFLNQQSRFPNLDGF